MFIKDGILSGTEREGFLDLPTVKEIWVWNYKIDLYVSEFEGHICLMAPDKTWFWMGDLEEGKIKTPTLKGSSVTLLGREDIKIWNETNSRIPVEYLFQRAYPEFSPTKEGYKMVLYGDGVSVLEYSPEFHILGKFSRDGFFPSYIVDLTKATPISEEYLYSLPMGYFFLKDLYKDGYYLLPTWRMRALEII